MISLNSSSRGEQSVRRLRKYSYGCDGAIVRLWISASDRACFAGWLVSSSATVRKLKWWD